MKRSDAQVVRVEFQSGDMGDDLRDFIFNNDLEYYEVSVSGNALIFTEPDE
ncbi:hypothetical protein [Mycobacterium paragordonae]|uniref:Uncharacterized protein n=1 Tax=Mycobacterium paragordonae TaxID=1389713 RepID=A0AAJ1S4Z3_9MYCO|nr:hypothetical protein [Mycobacterium paragordonae]MDP7733688.1 hypothetical protein [Mycobacterium paragordonae]